MGLGETLIRLQAERNVSNVELAKAVEVHPITVYRWRNGSDIKLSDCVKIASFFGLSLEEIFKDVDRPILED